MSEDSSIFDPLPGSLRKSVSRGALVTGGAQLVKLGCQVISVTVLSRLLSPQDFGIMAMAGPVFGFVSLFQDLGLMQATVQKRTITHAEVNSLFWINLALSTVLACVLLLVAPLAMWFYGDSRVGPLVAAFSILVLIYAAGGQHHALLNRRMQFGRIAVQDILTNIVAVAVAIVWAWIWPSYWALFASIVAGASFNTAFAWFNSRWRPSRPRIAPGTRGLVTFGAGVTGFNFANFFSRNMDYVLIGHRWGNDQLGLYDRAYKLLLFPLQQVTNPVGMVMQPALARMVDEPDRYRHAYLRVAPLLLLAVLPGVAFAIATADVLVPFALGKKWGGSAHIFQALGFAGLLQTLNSPSGWLFVSQGRSNDYLRWGIFSAVTSVAAFAIGLPYGAFGVAVAYAASEYLRTPLLWIYLGRTGPVRTGDVLRTGLPFVVGAHLAVLVVWLLRGHLPAQPVVFLLCAALVAYGVAIAFAALFASGRATLGESWRLIRRKAHIG